MNKIKKSPIILEHHCVHQQYAHLRLHKRNALSLIMASLQQYGQLVPVVVVPSVKNQWVLLDGYLRIKALQVIGQDTVQAEIWECSVADALLSLLKTCQSRAWKAFEEALLLRELHLHHALSQSDLAKQLGRDKSFISRRLSLIENLPENAVQAILTGTLSLWSAMRIVAPMARANTSHAESLLNYLLKHHHSSRELNHFYQHYQQANRPARLNMLNNLELFFKAQKVIALEKSSKTLKAGPEGRWQAEFNLLIALLTRLIPLVLHVFSPHQMAQEQNLLLSVFKKAQAQFELFTTSVRSLTDVTERDASNDYRITSERP